MLLFEKVRSDLWVACFTLCFFQEWPKKCHLLVKCVSKAAEKNSCLPVFRESREKVEGTGSNLQQWQREASQLRLPRNVAKCLEAYLK